MASDPSDKSRGVALALAFVLGVFGAHRFYAGKTGSGILMALTLGGVGVWYVYDLIVVASGGFRDDEGRLISLWDPEAGDREGLPSALMDEMDALRAEVAELSERMDFTERMLSAPRDAATTAAERRPS